MCPKYRPTVNLKDLPDHVDWRVDGYVSDVRVQVYSGCKSVHNASLGKQFITCYGAPEGSDVCYRAIAFCIKII